MKDELKKKQGILLLFLIQGFVISLLICAPGASLSAGVPASLLVAALLRGLPCPVLPQESSHLPLQSTGVSIKVRNSINNVTQRKLTKLNRNVSLMINELVLLIVAFRIIIIIEKYFFITSSANPHYFLTLMFGNHL